MEWARCSGQRRRGCLLSFAPVYVRPWPGSPGRNRAAAGPRRSAERGDQAIEQPLADFDFKLGDLLAERGLCDMAGLHRSAKTINTWATATK